MQRAHAGPRSQTCGVTFLILLPVLVQTALGAEHSCAGPQDSTPIMAPSLSCLLIPIITRMGDDSATPTLWIRKPRHREVEWFSKVSVGSQTKTQAHWPSITPAIVSKGRQALRHSHPIPELGGISGSESNGKHCTSSPALKGQRHQPWKEAELPRRVRGPPALGLRAVARPGRPIWGSRSSPCRLRLLPTLSSGHHWELSALTAEAPDCL